MVELFDKKHTLEGGPKLLTRTQNRGTTCIHLQKICSKPSF